MSAALVKLVFKTKNGDVELSLEEARELYAELNRIFADKSYPYLVPHPTLPGQPSQPPWLPPYICWTLANGASWTSNNGEVFTHIMRS